MKKKSKIVECYVRGNHWYTLTYEKGCLRKIEASPESARLVCHNVPTTVEDLNEAIKFAQGSAADVFFKVLK